MKTYKCPPCSRGRRYRCKLLVMVLFLFFRLPMMEGEPGIGPAGPSGDDGSEGQVPSSETG